MSVVPLIIEPDPDDPDCAEVMVAGRIGESTCRFVLDTGAARTQVVADHLTRELTESGSYRSSGVFAPSQGRLVTVPELAVGPMIARNISVSLVEPDQAGVQNLLGMDVLKAHCCRFLFGTGALVVESSPAADAVLPLTIGTRAHPYLEVSWSGAMAQSVWDSGAGITVVDRAFWFEHQDLFEPAGTSVGTDATGARVETPTFVMAAPVIGGRRLAAHRVAVVDLSGANATVDRQMELILGWPTLRQADWVFDFPARRWGVGGPRPVDAAARGPLSTEGS